ncbi:unnamed protein product [Allacma fusca]|uniref:Leucine zipper transcription factor-like protein 1 n=1 Tax=Allacma fusca TaxID=39272 RepID=A0A8J2K3C8_9HEXA|nr:unnamed protein product [Allacma fusca]
MALDLNPIHTDLVSDFLQLSRYQQTQRIKSIEHCFSNLLNYKIREDDTYNGDEVVKLVQDLQEIVVDEVNTELTDAIHTNVLLTQQLLKQAEDWHLTLTTNVAELENREKLNAIKNYDESQKKDPEKPTITVTHLKNVIPLEDYGAATALKQEVVQLLAENGILKRKIEELEIAAVGRGSEEDENAENLGSSQSLSRELEKAQKEIELLSAALTAANTQDEELLKVETAVEKMRLELESTRKSAQEDREKLREDLESREDKLRQVQSSLLLAEKDLEKKFQATGAYANMKKMLMQKNRIIKQLRQKLAQYGAQEEKEEEEEEVTKDEENDLDKYDDSDA